MPPFSCLDAKQGYWQQRKKEWFSWGLDGGAGRDDDLLGAGLSALTPGLTGTSVFDPVLAEAVIQWYCPPPTGSAVTIVIDPFAGGSTRGVVCATRAGRLAVSDTGNGRVVVVDRRGGFVRAIGSKGRGAGRLAGPHGIACSPRTGR